MMKVCGLSGCAASISFLLLTFCLCGGISIGVRLAVAECTTPADCGQAVPNAASMRCINGYCVPLCKRGFRLTGDACISANITCNKGQQPSADGLKCVTCPQNTYKDKRGNMRCNPCPAGTLTAGRKRTNHDSRDKCLPGGLDSSAKDILPPRLRAFQQQLAAAAKYMRIGTLPAAALDGRNFIKTRNDMSDAADGLAMAAASSESSGMRASDPAINLTTGMAYIAGSPLVLTPYETVLRMPSRKPRVLEQGNCATCVNMAITSAAEAATAAASGMPADLVQLSPVFGYYCTPPLARSCSSGWTFAEALESLTTPNSQFLPATTCATEDLEWIRSASPSQLATVCDTIANRCDKRRQNVRCTYKPLQEFWEVQKHIRAGGAVLTRIDVTPGFVEFFRNNPTGVYTRQEVSSEVIPHAIVLVGYNNIEQYWWAQNSYGTSFADQGVFKVAYGAAFAANPNETFALTCSMATSPVEDPSNFNPGMRWSLTPLVNVSATGAACYSYTAQPGDYLAGIAEHFGLDMLGLVRRNTAILDKTPAGLPDLTTPLEGKEISLCGITTSVYMNAIVECGPGQYFAPSGACEVCPVNTYKETAGPGPCLSCAAYNQGVTQGCTLADHDSRDDCRPKHEYLLCEQYIGIYNKSGIYNITLNCKQYQVYCDMETDGGGWTLFLNYNVAAGTFPQSLKRRALDDGFPLPPIPPNPLGVDESSSTGFSGWWGHMNKDAMAALPFEEFRSIFEMGNPIAGVPGLPSVFKMDSKSNDAQTMAYLLSEVHGININNIRHESTPLPGQNIFMPADGADGFTPQVLWGIAQVAFVPVRHQSFVRGKNPNPPSTCPPGYYYPQGWGCYLCPDHTYKEGTGLGPCTPCPNGTVATAGVLSNRSAEHHDSAEDCKPAVPDVFWEVTRADGSNWLWEFFWSTRARPPLAEQICQQRGGHLITIESADTSVLLSAKIGGEDTGRPGFPFLHNLAAIWMGLYSENTSDSRTGPWTWYSAAGYDYFSNFTNWIRNNPDNYWREQGRNVAFLVDNGMLWDDYYSNHYIEFVCEKKLGN